MTTARKIVFVVTVHAAIRVWLGRPLPDTLLSEAVIAMLSLGTTLVPLAWFASRAFDGARFWRTPVQVS